MALTTAKILILVSVLLFVSILASKIFLRIGVPALLLFLIVGMLAGYEGPGGIYFDDPGVAQFLGIICLTFILFSGGLDTRWESVKPVTLNAISLSTLGVFLTALGVGAFAAFVLNIPLSEGLLIGSIVSSTDAAAVFSILRSKNVGLKGNLRPLLEFESGSNDPMAYLLTISMIEIVLAPETSFLKIIPRFFQMMSLGAVCGYGFGRAMNWIINRVKLDYNGLYPVLVLSLVLLTFSITEAIGGNGFLATYMAGIFLGNSSFIHKKSLIKFFDGIAWLAQIVLFLTLGLLVFPSEIVPIIGEGLLIAMFLMVVARPAAVFISLFFSKDLNLREKWLISWVGLRGAAPIVFSTYPLLAGIEYAGTIFNLVFFISVSSVLLQGTTVPIVAKWLHVAVSEKARRKFPLDIELEDDFKSELIQFFIPEKSEVAGKPIVQLDLPKSTLIVLIVREDKYLTPSGDTVLQPGDHLLVMADSKETVRKIYEYFGVKEQ